MTFAIDQPKGKQISTKTGIDDEETSRTNGMLTIPIDERDVNGSYAKIDIARCAGCRRSVSYSLELTLAL